MPKATVFCGSAKPYGVTRSMCRAAERYLRTVGYEVDMLFLADMHIDHCTDCGACLHRSCVRDDDMHIVYDSFSSSDLLILASPIHFSGPSSIIKTAMDRFQVYWYDRTLKHPAKCLALLCGGSEKPRFEYTVSIFRAFALTTGMEWLGHLEVPDTDRNGDTGVPAMVTEFLESVIKP